jgi:hypothetical protein
VDEGGDQGDEGDDEDDFDDQLSSVDQIDQFGVDLLGTNICKRPSWKESQLIAITVNIVTVGAA